MKREDIDKRISMPDVDAEWARFERDVIGKNTKPNRQRVAAWAGGIGIAATIALLFVLNIEKIIVSAIKKMKITRIVIALFFSLYFFFIVFSIYSIYSYYLMFRIFVFLSSYVMRCLFLYLVVLFYQCW